MKRTILFITLLLLPPAIVRVASEVRRYPDRFAEVVPHEIYRGAYPTREQVARLGDELGIRRVVNLTDRTNRREERDEQAVAAERGIEVLQFPLPGNGCGSFEVIDAAADAVASPKSRPVFFHCAAGKQRSNMVQAAFRIKYCGWSADEALNELEKLGLDRHDEQALCEHIRAYAEWLKRRPTSGTLPSVAGSSSSPATVRSGQASAPEN